MREDVELGYVSNKQAREAYGVILTHGQVDVVATEELRTRMKAEKVHIPGPAHGNRRV